MLLRGRCLRELLPKCLPVCQRVVPRLLGDRGLFSKQKRVHPWDFLTLILLTEENYAQTEELCPTDDRWCWGDENAGGPAKSSLAHHPQSTLSTHSHFGPFSVTHTSSHPTSTAYSLLVDGLLEQKKIKEKRNE